MSAPFGGTVRVYVTKKVKAFFDSVLGSKQMPSLSSVFSLSAAIGFILEDDSHKVSKPLEIMNVYTFEDAMLFEILIAWRHPDLSPKERLQKAQEYAESGAIHLQKHYKKYNGIDLSILMNDLVESGSNDSSIKQPASELPIA